MSGPENHVLREFLLHRLGEAEAHALEERLMTEDGFLEALQDAEHDLLDDYANGQLSAEDRADVERHLLATPEARQRLEIARALTRAGTAGAASSQRDERAAASVAPRTPERSILAASSQRDERTDASVAPRTPERSVSAASSQRDERTDASVAPRTPELSASNAAARARPRPRRTWQLALAAAACVAVVAFLVPFRFNTVDTSKTTELLLLADNSRGTTARGIDIDTSAAAVTLQLEVPSASPTAVYDVEVLDEKNQRTHEAHALHAQNVSGYSVVQLTVPSSVFQNGPHTIILRESQPGDPTTPPAEAFRWQININRR